MSFAATIDRLHTNFFQPVQKLVRKERNGAKVRRVHDAPKTPYQRVLASLQDRLFDLALKTKALPDRAKEVPQREYISL